MLIHIPRLKKEMLIGGIHKMNSLFQTREITEDTSEKISQQIPVRERRHGVSTEYGMRNRRWEGRVGFGARRRYEWRKVCPQFDVCTPLYSHYSYLCAFTLCTTSFVGLSFPLSYKPINQACAGCIINTTSFNRHNRPEQKALSPFYK